MADKWIIATGLSRGIGAEFGEKLNDEGYKIIHLGRKKIGFEKEFLWWDLLNPIQDNPIADLHKLLPDKDIFGFFYGAGLMPTIEIKEKDALQKKLFWQSQGEAMRVNYMACAELVEEILPYLFKPYSNPDEKFIPFIAHISSLAAITPLQGFELYGATKAAALLYFSWLSKRYTADKLSCLSIHPGTVYTDMIKDIMLKEKPESPIVQQLTQLQEDGLMTTPDDAANKIFDFIFYDAQMKTNSHGKMYLADSNTIV